MAVSLRKETLAEVLKRHNVKIAYLFGSQKESGFAFLNNDESVYIEEGSDLDIGLVFKQLPQNAFEIYGGLYADLSLLFLPFNVDMVFLQETDCLFQYEAIKGEVIYYEDAVFLDNYEELVMKMASDLSFKKEEFERDFFEAVKDGYFEITLR